MTAAFAPYSPVRYAYRRVRSAYTRTLAGQNIVVNGHHLAPGIRTSRQASRVRRRRNAVESSRRIAAAMTKPKRTSASENDVADPKEKPYVPIEHRPLLGVPEAATLTGLDEKVIRQAIRQASSSPATSIRRPSASDGVIWTIGCPRCRNGRDDETAPAWFKTNHAGAVF